MARNTRLIGVCGIIGVAVLGVWFASAQHERPEQGGISGAQRPFVSWSGPHSGLPERCHFRITSEKQWRDVWTRHVGDAAEKDTFGYVVVPAVDFERCMVVAVFQGRRENNNGVVAVSVTEDGEQMKVRLQPKPYQTGPVGDPVTPYGIFVLPRSAKSLLLEEDARRNWGPPVWRERARFGELATRP